MFIICFENASLSGAQISLKCGGKAERRLEISTGKSVFFKGTEEGWDSVSQAPPHPSAQTLSKQKKNGVFYPAYCKLRTADSDT